jgi:hypothetical protein
MSDKSGLIITGLSVILLLLGIAILSLIASYRNNSESSTLSKHLTTVTIIAAAYTLGFGALIYLYVLKHVDNISEFMILGQLGLLIVTTFSFTSATLNAMMK